MARYDLTEFEWRTQVITRLLGRAGAFAVPTLSVPDTRCLAEAAPIALVWDEKYSSPSDEPLRSGVSLRRARRGSSRPWSGRRSHGRGDGSG